MKVRVRARASSLFLIELIIAILVFSIASAYCVKAFVASSTISKEAQCYAAAASECSGIAELVTTASTYDEAFGRIRNAYPDADICDNTAMNSKMTVTLSDGNSLKLHLYTDGNMLKCDMSSSDVDYKLNVKHYMQGGAR